MTLIDYLMYELPVPLAGENGDVLPYVRARAEPEGGVTMLAKRLHDEHATITARSNPRCSSAVVSKTSSQQDPETHQSKHAKAPDMKKTLSNARVRDTHHHSTDMDLLADPLEFLEEDHLRTRTVCATFDRIADSETPASEDVFEALTYLENELPLFIVDEDADLVRLIRQHLDAAPRLFEVLPRVTELHQEIAFRSRPVIDLLQILKKQRRGLTYSEQACLRDLATSLRTDMALENSKLLPLARKLLTDEDLSELRSAMFQRRLSDFRDHRATGA